MDDKDRPKEAKDEKLYRTVEERAQNHYQAMVVLNPKDSRQYIKLGDAMCLQEKYQNAILAF